MYDLCPPPDARNPSDLLYLRTPPESTHELSGWKTLGVMEGVGNKAKSEAVGPEKRSAISRAGPLRGREFSAKDLVHGVSLADELEARVEQGACSRAWFHRFRSLKEYLAPSAVLPIRENLTGILGRRPRASALLGAQTRVSCRGGRSIGRPFDRASAPMPGRRCVFGIETTPCRSTPLSRLAPISALGATPASPVVCQRR